MIYDKIQSVKWVNFLSVRESRRRSCFYDVEIEISSAHTVVFWSFRSFMATVVLWGVRGRIGSSGKERFCLWLKLRYASVLRATWKVRDRWWLFSDAWSRRTDLPANMSWKAHFARGTASAGYALNWTERPILWRLTIRRSFSVPRFWKRHDMLWNI